MRSTIHKAFYLWVVMAAAFAGIAQEDTSRTETLITNPPFKSVDTSRPVQKPNYATSGTINDRFQLAGVLDVGGTLRFSIHDKQGKKPYWVQIGQEFEGVSVVSYDALSQGVVLRMANRTEMITLRQADNQSRYKNPMGSFNAIRPSASNTKTTPKLPSYPKPPPNLPKPKDLLDKIRKEKAKIINEME